MTWRTKLRARLEARGVTPRDLAGRLGVTTGAVSHWLTGKREPSIETIRTMVSLAGMTLDELFQEPDKFLVASKDEIEVVELLRDLTPQNAEAARTMLRALAQKPADPSDKNTPR